MGWHWKRSATKSYDTDADTDDCDCQCAGCLAGDCADCMCEPTATTIAMGNVVVSYSNTVNYAARTFTIPTPTSATWYYVTIADPQQGGETGPTLAATCQTSTGLVGATGNVYIGAINALPTGNATQILAGGWPAPQTTQVGD